MANEDNLNTQEESTTIIDQETPVIAKTKETKKVEAGYVNAMTALSKIFNGIDNIKSVNQVEGSNIPKLMGELFKDEKKELEDQFKLGAKNLIKTKVAYDKFIMEQYQKLQSVKNAKMKEFTTEANRLVKMVDNIGELEQHYASVLLETVDDAKQGSSSD